MSFFLSHMCDVRTRYPRRYFFEQICGVLASSPKRHACPIFTDKHLAVTWDDAMFIYEKGKALGTFN
eukprot:COSAG03_NODE_2007_length_3229_cov_6.566134_4_plen_67_part_00